jgi:hypothetical protein
MSECCAHFCLCTLTPTYCFHTFLYFLQDLEEVGGAALAVFEVTELMADECPDPEAVGAEQLSTLNQQLMTAHQQVQQLLDQAAPGGQQEQEQQEETDDGEHD